MFAANLNAGGFDRGTINAALGVHTTELSRLLAVAVAIPAAIVKQIGPAPKAGRTRWMELAEYLQTNDAQQLALQTLNTPSLEATGDRRKIRSIDGVAPRRRFGAKDIRGNCRNALAANPLCRITRSGRGLRVWVDGRFGHGFGAYLIRSLPDLMHRFDTETDQVRDQ